MCQKMKYQILYSLLEQTHSVFYVYGIMPNEKYCIKFGNKKFVFWPRFSTICHFFFRLLTSGIQFFNVQAESQQGYHNH